LEPGEVPEEPARPWQPEKYPSWPRRLLWGIRDLPGTIATHLPRAIQGFKKKRKVNEAYRQAGKPPPPSASVMPQTPINKALSHGRTFVCDTVPLDTIKHVRATYGVTINDVFLSCCAAAVRQLLLDKDYNPAQGPLVAGIPISGSRPDSMRGIGNFATADFTWLHADIEDPVERLRATSKSAAEMKEHIEAARGADINTLVQLAPPWLAKLIRWGIREQKGKFGIFGNVVLSNVPGPKKPLYFEHCKVDNWFSIGQVFDGTSLNMTLWSYTGNANLCILADRQVLPDGWVLFEYFRDELNRLQALAETETSTPAKTETAKVEATEH
ncbi:MAG: WS/DGAT domain-containing protein, partial [Pseudomonadales bacterium]